MPYPGRGPWRFRNQTQGFDFWPRLESVEVTDAHPYDTATLSFEVVDPEDALVFQPEDRVWVTFAGVRIFAGHVKLRTRTQLSEMGVRVYRIECQDYTAKLDDSVITRRPDRKEEGIRARLRWIHEHLNFNAHLDVSGVPTGERAPDANYHGMTVLEAFEQVADEESLFMQMDLDPDGDGVPTLSFFRVITDVAEFDLDDAAPDYSTTFPYSEFEDTDDSAQLATMVYVIPEDEAQATWVTNAAQRAVYGWQQSSVSDSSVKGRNGAVRIGGRFLDEFDQPLTEGSCTVWQPGLRSGQRIRIKNATWGLDYVRYITEVSTTAVDPHGADGEAYLRSAIRFSDRRRTRRRPGRPGRGDTTVPTAPAPLDTYQRTSSPPTMTPAGAAGSFGNGGFATRGRNVAGDDVVEVPFQLKPGKADRPVAGASWDAPHTSRPSWTSCAGLDYAQVGWSEGEQWFRMTVGTHPADAAGISVTVGRGGGRGIGSVAPMEVVARSSQPTAMRQGTVVGTVAPDSTATLVIPASLVPEAGQSLWVGYRCGWETAFKDRPFGYSCGWPSPSGAQEWQVDDAGNPWRGHQGDVQWTTSPQTPTWQAWDSAPPDLGAIDEHGEDAPVVGGNAVQDAGFEGEGDAWSVEPGTGFVVGASTPSGKGLTVVGAGEDELQPAGAWSTGLWGHEVHFVVSAHGSLTDPGLRHVESVATTEGRRSVGRVQLGDAAYPEGIYVAGPTDEGYLEKALTTGEVWVARFDTRSGTEVRGKLWRASDGMPAAWDVRAALDDTEDDLDRWTLWLRAGNDGSPQEVRVLRTLSLGAAAAGQRVVLDHVGLASGAESWFEVAQPFRPGSIHATVNGVVAPAAAEDGPACRFDLDFRPTAGSVVRATYVAA